MTPKQWWYHTQNNSLHQTCKWKEEQIALILYSLCDPYGKSSKQQQFEISRKMFHEDHKK
jgi:hypothetical protein